MIEFLEKRLGLVSAPRALAAGGVLAVVLLVAVELATRRALPALADPAWLATALRWLHVLAGIVWMGLLWFFNFVQMPALARLPEDQKPVVIRAIAPAALWWFRHAALVTLATGLALALVNGYLAEALALGVLGGGPRVTAIGVGMWLGVWMAANVWMAIWPAQRLVLGIEPAAPEERAAAARRAAATGRLNLALSLPMLAFMVAAQNLY